MQSIKSHFQFFVLVLSLVFANTALAAEEPVSESKDNGAETAINAAPATPVDAMAVTAVSEQQEVQPETLSDAKNYRQQFEERRRQAQQAQLDAYKQFLERRKQYASNNPGFDSNIPAYIQERRNLYIKQMEERRALNVKMMEEQRKATEERRRTMLIKMNQTNSAPESIETVSPTKV